MTRTYVPPSIAVSNPALKTSREKLDRLELQLTICPQVLLRVLGIVARFDRIPLGLSVTTARDAQRVCIELDPLPVDKAETMLAVIENVIHVQWVVLNGAAAHG